MRKFCQRMSAGFHSWEPHRVCLVSAPAISRMHTMTNHPENQSIHLANPRRWRQSAIRAPQGASKYLLKRYSFGSFRMLAKYVVTGGGPTFQKLAARFCIATKTLILGRNPR